MLSVHEAQTEILKAIAQLEIESVALDHAAGRFAAEDIRSPIDLPPFNNSGMDGYAVLARDTETASDTSPVRLKVIGTVAAGGLWNKPLQAGEAIRIMTGAAVPLGADAVVMIEETQTEGDSVLIFRKARTSGNIRPQGEDVPCGKRVIERGTRLRAAEVGLLAAMGLSEVQVHRRPKVSVISTGDELLPIGEPLAPGRIHDSNSYMIAAAAEQAGVVVHSRHHVEDRPDVLRRCLESLLPEVDVILTTGGVSVGDFDVVKAVVGDLGQINFWKVAMKPGKPLVFADLQGKPMFGLPGNPVSSMVTFELFVRPSLLKMQGSKSLMRPLVHSVLMEECRSAAGREEYVRAKTSYADGQFQSYLCGAQGSGRISGLVESNSLLAIPAETTQIPSGTVMLTIMTDWEA